MKWFAVPSTGGVSTCEECGAPLAWIDGPYGRMPLDLRDLRGEHGAWEANPHGPKCTSDRWKGHTDQGVDSRDRKTLAETDPGNEATPGDGSLF